MHCNSIITKGQARSQCKIMSIAKANTHCMNLYTLVDFAVFAADKEEITKVTMLSISITAFCQDLISIFKF